MELNERLENLEIRLASQDDLLDVLNQTIYRQQKKIDELDALCAALARRITEFPAQASGALPHDPRGDVRLEGLGRSMAL